MIDSVNGREENSKDRAVARGHSNQHPLDIHNSDRVTYMQIDKEDERSTSIRFKDENFQSFKEILQLVEKLKAFQIQEKKKIERKRKIII